MKTKQGQCSHAFKLKLAVSQGQITGSFWGKASKYDVSGEVKNDGDAEMVFTGVYKGNYSGKFESKTASGKWKTDTAALSCSGIFTLKRK